MLSLISIVTCSSIYIPFSWDKFKILNSLSCFKVEKLILLPSNLYSFLGLLQPSLFKNLHKLIT